MIPDAIAPMILNADAPMTPDADPMIPGDVDPGITWDQCVSLGKWITLSEIRNGSLLV